MGYYRPWKPHFLKYFYLFLNYFWPCWVFVATWAFSSCGEQGRGSSLVVVRRLLVVGASLAAERRLQGKQGSGVPAHLVVPRHVASSGPGIDPPSPALAGRFLTTGPPGKSCNFSMIASPLYAMTGEAPPVPVVQNPLSKDAFQEP